MKIQQYLAIIVKIWVESNRLISSGLQVDERRRVGIVLGKVDVKLKAPIGVRGVRGTSDQNLQHNCKE
jgi:hypothetical protein